MGTGVYPDFVAMLVALSEESAEFLLVGAHALAAHGIPRATADLDLFVRPTTRNAPRVLKALKRFGAPLFDLSVQDLCRPDVVFQFGNPPLRIDLLTGISGVSFEEAWKDRIVTHIARVQVAVIGLEALIRNKQAAARPKDLVDVLALKQLKPLPGRRARTPRRPGKPRR